MTDAKSDKPRFSKKAVNRAGERLVVDPTDEEALEVLDYWRGLHAKPLEKCLPWIEKIRENIQIDCRQLKHRGEPADEWTSISSRLKRGVSIIQKLVRYPSMRLSSMQDIAGIRLVWNSPYTHGRVVDHLIDLMNRSGTPANIKGAKQYTMAPKESGYRAVHIVIEYRSVKTDPSHEKLLEIQLRSRLQHLWAMAVETIGMFYGQALKASQGDQKWLDFFKLASAALSHVEHTPVVAEHAEKSFEKIRTELLHEGTEKSFFSKLAAIKEVDEKYSAEDYDYWLLELNIKKSENRIFGFKSGQIETAQEMYSAKEQTPACRRGDVQVVLVSTQSFKDLRQAYPSYFLDVADFTKTIKQICYEGTIPE